MVYLVSVVIIDNGACSLFLYNKARPKHDACSWKFYHQTAALLLRKIYFDKTHKISKNKFQQSKARCFDMRSSSKLQLVQFSFLGDRIRAEHRILMIRNSILTFKVGPCIEF